MKIKVNLKHENGNIKLSSNGYKLDNTQLKIQGNYTLSKALRPEENNLDKEHISYLIVPAGATLNINLVVLP